jgi:putative ABC transport system permease protein
MENPKLKTSLMLIFDWWQDEKEDTETNSSLLFEKILQNIKPADTMAEETSGLCHLIYLHI